MDTISMNKQLGTKWFTFYTKVRPWLACFTCLTVIMDFVQHTDIYLSNFFLLVYFAGAIAQPVLSVIVAIKSEEDYGDFVRFVKAVLLFETINMAYQQGIQQYIKDFEFDYALLIFVIILVIGYFTWYRLNVKYFEKRIVRETAKSFEITKEINNEINNDEELLIASDSSPISYCRKCGCRLGEDALFCSKCGTKIEQ